MKRRRQPIYMVWSNKFLKGSTFMFVSKVAASFGPVYILSEILEGFGSEQFGELSNKLILIGVIVYLVQYSFSLRQTKQLINNELSISTILSKGISLKAFLAFFGCLFFILLADTTSPYSMMLSSVLLAESMHPRWYLLGLRRFSWIAIYQVVLNILMLLIYYLFREINIHILYSLIFGLTPITLNALLLIKIFREYKISFSRRNIFADLIDGMPYFIIQITPVLYTYGYIIIYGFFNNGHDSGRMYMELKYLTAVIGIYSVMTSVSYTFVHDILYKNVKKLLWITAFLLFLILLLCSDMFWDFLTSGLYGILSFRHKLMFAIIPILFSARTIYGLNGLIIRNKTKIYLLIAIISSCVACFVSIIIGASDLIIPLFIGHFCYALLSVVFSKLEVES